MSRLGNLLSRGTGCVVALVLLAGCGWFGDDDEAEDGATGTISVFDLEPEDCVVAPPDSEAKAEVVEVEKVDCDQAHNREVFAMPAYTAIDPAASEDAFPGEQELTDFADGACAQEFEAYVGLHYADSRYFFTYLLPTPQSWEDSARRYVLCFVSAPGEEITRSLKGAAQ